MSKTLILTFVQQQQDLREKCECKCQCKFEYKLKHLLKSGYKHDICMHTPIDVTAQLNAILYTSMLPLAGKMVVVVVVVWGGGD